MAVINNLSASLTSFKINDVSKSFLNSGGTYNTPDLLNGGETYDESTLSILSYVFKVLGLQGHTIKDITIQSLLLTNTGELSGGIRFAQNLDGKLITDIINGNSETKVFGNTKFTLNKLIEDSQYEFIYEISNRENKSCIYCLRSIIIELSDIKYKIYISFNGPLSGRSVSKIQTSSFLQSLDAVDVTFSKDPTKEFDQDLDSIEGRAYFRKEGIYIDGYQYGTVAPATVTKSGIVKLANKLDFLEGVLVNELIGIAATPLLVLNTLLQLDTLVKDGILAPADSSTYGILKLSESHFEMQDVLDENGNVIGQEIVAPNELGVAASTLLVFNVLATAKNYTDELITPILEFLDGIEAPLNINIENDEGEKESLGEELTFSNDFELKDKKLYIKWLEII